MYNLDVWPINGIFLSFVLKTNINFRGSNLCRERRLKPHELRHNSFGVYSFYRAHIGWMLVLASIEYYTNKRA